MNNIILLVVQQQQMKKMQNFIFIPECTQHHHTNIFRLLHSIFDT